MNRLFSGRSDMPFALLLLAPSLLLLGGLVAWPMVSNIEISFFTSAAQSQHRVNLCWGE
ncbi:binding-protein-dependent transport system inner membrane protein [Escherichia coli]|nr:binding-protein-dependent transport system inner membrane protein [Escherichia coli]